MQPDGTTNGQPGGYAFRLSHDGWGRLLLTDAAGQLRGPVEPIRAFPISEPRSGIALCDPAGHELVWIDQLDNVHEPERRLIEEELARRELVPVVRRIIGVSAPMEPSEWEVETDRGLTKFILDSEEKVRRLDEHGALILDANGIRYLIPDTRRLDAASRRLLERYL